MGYLRLVLSQYLFNYSKWFGVTLLVFWCVSLSVCWSVPLKNIFHIILVLCCLTFIFVGSGVPVVRSVVKGDGAVKNFNSREYLISGGDLKIFFWGGTWNLIRELRPRGHRGFSGQTFKQKMQFCCWNKSQRLSYFRARKDYFHCWILRISKHFKAHDKDQNKISTV